MTSVSAFADATQNVTVFKSKTDNVCTKKTNYSILLKYNNEHILEDNNVELDGNYSCNSTTNKLTWFDTSPVIYSNNTDGLNVFLYLNAKELNSSTLSLSALNDNSKKISTIHDKPVTCELVDIQPTQLYSSAKLTISCN